jgi:transposase InsO family protein
MQVFKTWKGFKMISAKAPPELSQKEIDRLRAVELFRKTRDVKLVCSLFGISRPTLYRLNKRYDPEDLASLKDKSRKPKHLRTPKWPSKLIIAVRDLREEWPGYGKDKLVRLLKDEKGMEATASTIGRIIGYLKRRGELAEPVRKAISRKRREKRPYAVRKPKEYTAKRPGDIVQVDTLDIRPLPGLVLKQFTARDVVSKWDVLVARTRATANTASEFLQVLVDRTPFKIKAIQVDGGSEFCAEFEENCRQRGIKLFVLPPRSPKLNGGVERANRTHTEDFYELYQGPWNVAHLNSELLKHELKYNTRRPHESLGQITPLKFLLNSGIIDSFLLPALSHM